MRHSKRATVTLAVFFFVSLAVISGGAQALAADATFDVRGNVFETIDADQTQAERLFATAEAAIYFPSARRVRWLAVDGSLTPPAMSTARGTRTLREFEEELERDFPRFRDNAHGPYLLKTPASIGTVEALAQAEFAPAAPLATVFTESFESGMTNWTITNNTSDLYSWGTTTCEKRTGLLSADAMRGGTNKLGCSDAYAANVTTMMVHKSCEAIQGASQAWLDAYIRLGTESGFDKLGFYYADASGAGYGYEFTGNAGAWYHLVFNLRQWYRVGDLTTVSCPRLAIQFYSNATTESGIGARIDDITIGNSAPGFLTAAITATPSSGTVPLAVNFASSVAGATSAATYLWSFGDAASTTASTPTATFTYTAAGDYWPRLTVTDSGVRAAANTPIRATSAAACTVTCTASAPSTIAAGTAVLFQATATATGCSGTPSYSWDFGDTQVSIQQNASHTFTNAGTYNWTLTTSISGTSCAKSGSITVTSPVSGSKTVRRRVVTPPSGSGDRLASGTIGAAGGSVSGGGLTLTVPAGAFSSTSTIVLKKAAGTPRQVGDASDTYVVSGLPSNLLRDIAVDIDVSGSSLAAGEKYYIAADAAVYIKSLASNQSDTVKMIPVEATLSGSKARITLPSTWSMPKIASASPSTESTGARPNVYTGDMRVKAEKLASYQTDHFYALALPSESSQATSILDLLESHYQKLTSLGFSLDCRIDSATKQFRRIRIVPVALGTGNDDPFGSHVSPWTGSDPCGTNWLFSSDYIAITTSYASTDSKVRWAAGHELFHLVQDIYSPGGARANLWLKEASSIWYELALGNPCPDVQNAYPMFPWKGLFNSKNSAAPGDKASDIEAHHGYGASYFLWHHSPSNTDPFVRIIWDLIRGGSSEVAAVQGAMGSTKLADDWLEFARDYFYGKIGGCCLISWAGGSVPFDSVEVADQTALPASIGISMYPLSARSWALKLQKFTSSSALPALLTATGLIDNQSVYLYDVKAKKELAELTKASPRYRIDDLSALKTVLVAVLVDRNLPTGDANSQSSTNDVTLSLTPAFSMYFVNAPYDDSQCHISLFANGTVNTWVPMGFFLAKWNGSSFEYTGSGTESRDYGTTLEWQNAVRGSVSADKKILSSLTVEYHSNQTFPASTQCATSCSYETWGSIAIDTIPAGYDWAPALLHYKIEGLAARQRITKFLWRVRTSGWTSPGNNWDCTLPVDNRTPADGKIEVTLY